MGGIPLVLYKNPMVLLCVPKETMSGETRVAATPETVGKLVKSGLTVQVESQAGTAASFLDAAFTAAGAQIIDTAGWKAAIGQADIVIKVNKPSTDEISAMKAGAVFMGFLQPFASADIVQKLADGKISALAMELLPRITRAQRMDALSAMSTVAGYKAALLAANSIGRFMPMLTTAAGTISPAKAIVIGAGVAGLQAMATAKRLGAVVTAFDTRPAAGEQVKSLGCNFVDMQVSHDQAQDAGGYAKEQSAEFYKQEQDILRKYSKDADIIISTALIPGKKAPVLITEEMVKEMKPGSVIVDMSVEAGGNCTLSELGKTVVKHGVTLIGVTNLPATMPVHASQLYAKTVLAFLGLICPDGKALKLDPNDEIIKGSMVTHQGAVVHPAVKDALAKGK